jgi:hypothetical protein
MQTRVLSSYLHLVAASLRKAAVLSARRWSSVRSGSIQMLSMDWKYDTFFRCAHVLSLWGFLRHAWVSGMGMGKKIQLVPGWNVMIS